MGTDKALLEVDGRPMVLRVADALAASGAGPIVVVGGAVAALGGLGLTVLPDPHPDSGPLGGILAGLAAARAAGAELVLVSACDHPDLDGPTLAALRAELVANPTAGVAHAVDPTGSVPLVLALRVGSVEAVASACFARGERSIRCLLAAVPTCAVPGLAAPALADADRPGDLRGR